MTVHGPCRLCGGPTQERFRLTVLGRHDVGYHECDACGSVQSDIPTWLPEAYDRTRPDLDTGRCERNLQMVLNCATLLRALALLQDLPALDFGCGDGMFVRMMRDRGFDFRGWDRYADGHLAGGFALKSLEGARADLATAFEVLEHFPEPARDLREIFALEPRLLLFTTEIYSGQGPDWWYLSPETGQHVFFYSAAALRKLAAAEGFVFIDFVFVKAFVRRDLRDAIAARRRAPEAMAADIARRPAAWRAHVLAELDRHMRSPWKHVEQDDATRRAALAR